MSASPAKPASLAGSRRWPAFWPLLAVLATAVLTFRYQSALMHRIIDRWDDEGYLMVMVHHYLQGRKLYTELFSQYGPFYVEAQAALFRLLHQPVTNDSNRVVAALWWAAATVLAGVFVYRVRRNVFLACAASLATCLNATVLSVEPGHPQQVVLLLMVLACFATTLRPKLAATVFGASIAAICLTKINVGVFTVAAALGALVASAPRSLGRRLGEAGLLLYAAVFPAILMRRDLRGDDRWYCMIATLVGIAAFAVAFRLSEGYRARPRVGIMVAAFSALVVVSIGWQEVKGVSLAALLDGILVAPLHHPLVFNFPLAELSRRCAIETVALCALSLVVVPRPLTGRVAGVSMLLASSAVLCWLFIGDGRLAFVALALLPFGLLPLRRDDLAPEGRFARVFVTLLAATQVLHAYPVAGSQVHMALVPAVLWCFLCFGDGCSVLAQGEPMEGLLTGIPLLAMLLLMVEQQHVRTELPVVQLSLPGADHLLMTPDQAASIANIAANLRSNCDMLASLPGLGSFNFWSGLPLPDGHFMNGWVPGVPLIEQQQTLARLQADPQACLVYDPWSVRFWHFKPGDMNDQPLSRYMLTEMRTVHTAGGYEIRVSPQRTTPWHDIP